MSCLWTALGLDVTRLYCFRLRAVFAVFYCCCFFRAVCGAPLPCQYCRDGVALGPRCHAVTRWKGRQKCPAAAGFEAAPGLPRDLPASSGRTAWPIPSLFRGWGFPFRPVCLSVWRTVSSLCLSPDYVPFLAGNLCTVIRLESPDNGWASGALDDVDATVRVSRSFSLAGRSVGSSRCQAGRGWKECFLASRTV